jgi:glycosyltransferase involved in cell wall biosynthesis
LESLLTQDIISDMEILVVDDHGQDNSIVLVKRLQIDHKHGERIRILCTERNSGAWAARNVGLENAIGEWVGFVDADDWCDADMYSRLMTEAEAKRADWAYCLICKEFGGGRTELIKQPFIVDGEMTEAKRRLMLTRGVAYFSTGIYRKEFLADNDIRFPLGKFSEDSFFWWLTVMYCRRFAVVDQVGYHYRIQPESVSKQPDLTKARQKQQMYGDMLVRLRKDGLYEKYRQELDYLYLKKGLLIPLIIQAINRPEVESKEYRSFLDRMRCVDEVSVEGNKYYGRDCIVKVLYKGFEMCPRIMSRLLRLKYRRDPF